MDLNELPPEFDSDFLDDSSGNPFYCTQPLLDYSGSSVVQQGGSHQNQFAVRVSEQFGSHQGQEYAGNDVGAGEQVAVVTRGQFDVGGHAQVHVTNDAATQPGASVSGFEAHDSHVENIVSEDENAVEDITNDDADEVGDEIWSTPPIPYTGQTFDGKKEARQFYNMYAKRIGFSIRTGTTRLTAITREQRKVTYVCNKEVRGRKEKEDKANDDSDEDEIMEQVSEHEDNTDGAGKKRKRLDGGNKRKREKMQHTNCKAKLVLNLIGGRWQVTDFISEHNHELILKPSLKKFLRSHKGIPQAEKEFIIMLHGCNLSTGRIMQLMNEFYGSAQYQKIQEKCLVAEEGQEFKTEDRERRRWSKYPIERHASSVYTKNLFYRFSKEFEKTAEYDVKPAREFQYCLVPNNTKVYGYGKRDYIVTIIEGDDIYFCECSKFDRDGILCCHIMKILTRLGVKTIPEQYVLRSWTQKAVEDSEKCAGNAHLQADLIAHGMPLNNKKTLWSSVLSTSFAELAAEGCLSNERYTIMQKYIKAMCSEIDEIKKRKKASRQKKGNTLPLDPATTDGAEITPASKVNAAAGMTSGGDAISPSIPTGGASMAAVGNPPGQL
ncbi:unnamed protein product [Urochloa decumbens]|uniref:SWIM-type domain-containing protein n=1 Tax=Urochloa decumbens TaxID=240449 RepID=A0ABC9D9I6_9POAL